MKYLPLQSDDTSTQSTVVNEVFYIQDNGSLARDWITLSSDTVNFYNQILVSSLAVNNYVSLSMKVNPSSPTYMQQTYDIELRGTINTDFVMPVRFRVLGSRLCTVNDVREHLGALGQQKTTIAVMSDEFDNLDKWTQIVDTWTAANNRAVSPTVASSLEGIITYSAAFLNDYEVTVNVIPSTGTSGIIFGYVDQSNFYAVMLDVSNNLLKLIQKSSGSISTLKTVSYTVTAGQSYLMTVKMSDTGVITVSVDAADQLNYQFVSSIVGPVGLRVYNSASAQFFSFNLVANTYTVPDSTINDYIGEAEAHIFSRTRKLYNQQVFTEYYDFRDQPKASMPYFFTRTFNTFPGAAITDTTFKSRPLEQALFLEHRPILNVVSLEENAAADGSTDNWVLRSQGRSGDYIVYPNEGWVVWVNNFPNNGHRNIRVTYAAGSPQVPPNVRWYAALLAALMTVLGYSTNAVGVEALKKSLTEEITRAEEYVPRATLVGSPGGTESGQSHVMVG